MNEETFRVGDEVCIDVYHPHGTHFVWGTITRRATEEDKRYLYIVSGGSLDERILNPETGAEK